MILHPGIALGVYSVTKQETCYISLKFSRAKLLRCLYYNLLAQQSLEIRQSCQDSACWLHHVDPIHQFLNGLLALQYDGFAARWSADPLAQQSREWTQNILLLTERISMRDKPEIKSHTSLGIYLLPNAVQQRSNTLLSEPSPKILKFFIVTASITMVFA